MDFIVDFYQNLDALDMFIFWGVVIVIGLLLIFSIILVNKNKKLTRLVNNRELLKEKEENYDIPIYSNERINNKEHQTNTFIKESEYKNNPKEELFKMRDERLLEDLPDLPTNNLNNNLFNQTKNDMPKIGRSVFEDSINIQNHNIELNQTPRYNQNIAFEEEPRKNLYNSFSKISIDNDTKNDGIPKYKDESKNTFKEPVKEYLSSNTNNNENSFNAEELVQDYNIPKKEEKKETITNDQKELYKRNILKEMSFNQTSPINITSRDIKNDNKAIPVNKEPAIEKEAITKDIQKENIKVDLESQKREMAKRARDEYIKKEIEKYKQEIIKREKELSKNDESIQETHHDVVKDEYQNDDIDRTAYELEQEENAIISYKELMEKKDSIKTIDEEEAIISIEELMNKSKQKSDQNKSELYGLNDESEDKDFISELKKFRKDL